MQNMSSKQPFRLRQASVYLQGRRFERVFSGNGADEDVVVGSARAYVSALNKLISYQSASNQMSTGQESGNGLHKQQEVAV